MQITPCTIRISFEAPWSTASADYAKACALFRNLPIPGYPNGNAPIMLTVLHYNREIRADAIRRCAARLIPAILSAKGIRTVGPLLIVQATFEPGHKFRCTTELVLRPDVSLPANKQFSPQSDAGAARRAEAEQWILSHAQCDIPDSIIRQILEPADRDFIQPGCMLWDEAANKALLHVIAHEIADRTGITVSEEQLEKHLEDLAASANTTAAQLRAIYNKNGHLEELRENLLIESVLNHLASRSAQIQGKD